MRRFLSIFLLFITPIVVRSQASQGSDPSQSPVASDSSAPSPQVMDAEALIVKLDWKAAEAKLSPWLVDHPSDARALFDAGYVADAQKKVDEAADLYRRAVEADPKRFEAQLSLGLLLARKGSLEDARSALDAAAKLDPGEAGPAAKARAWRALAEIDQETNPTQASTDLLEALKLSPETPEDTALAAELAAKSGQTDAAEAAYRRRLEGDPGNP